MGFSGSSLRGLNRICFIAMTLCFALSAGASNSGVTYQGRIFKPDGSPLNGQYTQFKLQIRTPDSTNCLMYEEVQSLDLRNSGGSFSLTINDGAGSRTDASGYSLDRIFANRGSFVFDPTTCVVSGGNYTPNVADGRLLVVLFKDETMASWEPIPATKINFVPFSFETKQIAGFSADSLLRVVNASGEPLSGVAPLSNAQYSALLDLANGTSAAYSRSGELKGTPVPTMNAGEVLGWNGSAWVSTAAIPAANSITATMLQNSSIDGTKLDPAISISTVGTLGSAVSTTRDFKIYAAAPSAFYVGMIANPSLAASYTLTWPLNSGASNQVLTTDGAGHLTWTTPSSAGITSLLGDVTASGPGSATAAVISVGGSTAAQIHTAELAANAATETASASTIVKRDSSGHFAASTITADALALNNAGSVVNLVNPAGSSYTLTLPAGTGASGQVLSTNGLGVTSWISPLSASTAFVQGGNAFGAAANFGTNDNFDLRFRTNGATAMTLSPAGNVGIGTTSPSGKLDVKGAIVMSGTSSGYTGFQPAAVAGSTVWTLPSADGTAGQFLSTNGAGLLTWAAAGSAGGDFLKDGSVAMTGNFKAFDGTSTAPSISFASDTDTGFYHTANGTLGFIANATEVIRFSSNFMGYHNAGGQIGPNFVNQALPTFTWAGDTNTGVYRPQADTIGLTTNGTEKVRVSPGGDVGIGTTSPSGRLDVKGSIVMSGATSGYAGFQPAAVAGSTVWTLPSSDGVANQVLTTNGSGVLNWSTPSASGMTDLTGDVTASGTGSVPATVANVGGVTAANIATGATLANNATATSTANAIVKRDGLGSFAANIGTFNGLALNNAGSVVNIVNPLGAAYTLTLPTGAGSNGQVLSTNGSGVTSWITPAGSSQWITQAPGINYMSGNVGIGTTSPVHHLDVQGAGDQSIHVKSSNDNQSLFVAEKASAAGQANVTFSQSDRTETWGAGLPWNASVNDRFALTYWNGAASSELVSFKSSGNVGIGTTAPVAKLQVNGVIAGPSVTADDGDAFIDFGVSNIRFTSASCGSFRLDNLRDGASYTLVVKGGTSALCSFAAWTGVGTGANLTVHLPADHAASTSLKHTVYSFFVAGTDVYMAWAPGL